MRLFATAIFFLLLAACAGRNNAPAPDIVTLSVMGTNDVHGTMLPKRRSGGIATFSGYVAALRAARSDDGGAVLLIDAGDMWQGSLESNLTEGATMIEAYNALGYAAATIGNHEFDFGPLGELATPAGAGDDPRGALRQRITEANFPVLSANIIDSGTGELIDWQNVSPSVLIEVAGIKVGVIGLITGNALQVIIAANAAGLDIAPLAESARREASKLRAQGADIVIVTAHAGGRCEEFDDPLDLSSCDLDSEIATVANALPPGLVDHIIAGHDHQNMAQIINGIAVTSSTSHTYGFDRVDFTFDRSSGHVVDRKVFPPQLNCPAISKATGECEWMPGDPSRVEPARYEGRLVQAMPAVTQIVENATAYAAKIKSETLGVTLETPFLRQNDPESPIFNLFTDALLAESGADIAIHNVLGGIRADLPAGELTFGRVFELYPFDNRLTIIDMSGAQLRRIIAGQAMKKGRRAGFSGMRVFVSCDDGAASVEMVLRDGNAITDDDRVRVVANDYLATGGDAVLTPAMPAGGFDYPYDSRLTRDLLVAWFKKRGGSLRAGDFSSETARRWNFSESFVSQCQDGV